MPAQQYPEAFGICVTVSDLTTALRFYSDLYAHDHVQDGVYAGISYISIMRDGETLVNILQRDDGNPLADIFPTLKVDSVAAYQEKITSLGGNVLIPADACPCTGGQFAICVDATGNQFMIKEARPA